MNNRIFAVPVALAVIATTPALADGDATKGAQVFKLCMACHSVKDQTKKVGPHLLGIVGRAVGSVEGFPYSDGIKAYAATAGSWDEAELMAYLENPKDVVKGTKMAFGGVKDEAKRVDLVAYLKTIAP